MSVLIRPRHVPLVLLGVVGLLTACTRDPQPGSPGNDGPPDPGNENEASPVETPEPSAEALPDFSLTNVNANSVSFGETVSPRDYLGQISAWYFGHAT